MRSLLLTLLLGLSVQQAPQSGTGTIAGTVVQNGSGAPIGGVEVRLHEGDFVGPHLRTAPTDANGHFSFTGLTPGPYAINAQREGFLGPGGGRSAIATLHLEDGKRAEITLKLLRTATIRGRVLDSE